MGYSGAKAFQSLKLCFRFLMQLCHFDMGLQSIVFQEGARLGNLRGTDQVLQ